MYLFACLLINRNDDHIYNNFTWIILLLINEIT